MTISYTAITSRAALRNIDDAPAKAILDKALSKHSKHFMYEGKRPRAVIIVEVKKVYMHCSKALRRSDMWNAEKQLTKKTFNHWVKSPATNTNDWCQPN